MKKGFFTLLSGQGPRRYILLSQRLIVLASLISLLGLPIFWWISYPLALYTVLLIALYLSSYGLIRLGLPNVGRYTFLIWLNTGVVFYSSTFGRELGVQVLFFALILLPLIMFSIHERIKMIMAFPISIVSFLLLEFTTYSLSPMGIQMPSILIRWGNISGYLIIMGLLLAYIKLFINSILRIKYKRERTVIKSAELKGIKKTIVLLKHEINNSLMSIMNGAYILERKLRDRTDQSDFVKIAGLIRENSERIASVIKQIDTLKASKTIQYTDHIEMLDLGEGEAVKPL